MSEYIKLGALTMSLAQSDIDRANVLHAEHDAIASAHHFKVINCMGGKLLLIRENEGEDYYQIEVNQSVWNTLERAHPSALAKWDSNAIRFTIDMNPIPKGRPRFGNGRAYTPERTVSYEEYVAYCARLALKDVFFENELICVSFTFKRKGKRLCDIDNLIKACLDAFNGTVWRDDTQVREIRAALEYGHKTGQTDVELLAEKAK